MLHRLFCDKSRERGLNQHVIFSGFGVTVIARDGRRFVRYDAGELPVEWREEEISDDEAARIRKSEKDAYAVLLACQRRHG